MNGARNAVLPRLAAVTVAAASGVVMAAGPAAAASTRSRGPTETAYVADAGSVTVTPINTATNEAGHAIRTGGDPQAIAITPNGKTAYVVNRGPGTVTPISTATNKAGRAIKAGASPWAIAITP